MSGRDEAEGRTPAGGTPANCPPANCPPADGAPADGAGADCPPDATIPGGPVRGRGPGFFFVLGLIYVLVLAVLIVSRRTHWLWVDRLPNPIGGIIPLAVPWFGALGAVCVSLYGVFDHNADWDRKWNYWHLARPLVGTVLGTMAYLIFVGFINATGTKPNVNASGENAATATDLIPYFVIAFIVGFREDTFRTLVKRVVDTLLGPGIPGVTPPATVSITPSPVDFGEVPVGTTKDVLVTVTNSGTGYLAIRPDSPDTPDQSGTQLQDPDGVFKLLSNSVAGAIIAPGSSAQVTIRFTAQAGPHTGTLTIHSNIGANPVPLSGTG